MTNVTIKMLAKELKVSVATVSKALKDSYDIGPATKQRVRDLATKLNYIPNPYAGSLRKRKSKTIAIVLPEVADSFFSVAINGIEAAAQEKGYHTLIYLTHERFEKENEIVKDCLSGRVDGVLMSLTAETETFAHVCELYNKHIPVVFFDRVCHEFPTVRVTTDDYEAGYVAAKHLIERGCKNLRLLSISNSLSISKSRTQGFLQALADHGQNATDDSIVMCFANEEKDYSLVKNLLSEPERPDGIVATVEKQITPIYRACTALGLSIPAQVKVIGFSNLATASILDPSLTTITQPAFEIGRVAAARLLKRLQKPLLGLPDETIVLKSALHMRNSTL